MPTIHKDCYLTQAVGIDHTPTLIDVNIDVKFGKGIASKLSRSEMGK